MIAFELLDEDDRSLPDDIFGIVIPKRYAKHDDKQPGGSSGSFVGRYRAEEGVWELVGMLIGSFRVPDGRLARVIIRPPEDVIRWLLEGEGEDVDEIEREEGGERVGAH